MLHLSGIGRFNLVFRGEFWDVATYSFELESIFPTYVYSVNASSKDKTDQTCLMRISASPLSGEGKMRSIDTVGIFHARATSHRAFKRIGAGEDCNGGRELTDAVHSSIGVGNGLVRELKKQKNHQPNLAGGG